MVRVRVRVRVRVGLRGSVSVRGREEHRRRQAGEQTAEAAGEGLERALGRLGLHGERRLVRAQRVHQLELRLREELHRVVGALRVDGDGDLAVGGEDDLGDGVGLDVVDQRAVRPRLGRVRRRGDGRGRQRCRQRQRRPVGVARGHGELRGRVGGGAARGQAVQRVGCRGGREGEHESLAQVRVRASGVMSPSTEVVLSRKRRVLGFGVFPELSSLACVICLVCSFRLVCLDS